MLGTLSQLVSVCSAANGYLRGRFAIDGFFPRHADFKFCRNVVFVEVKRNWLGRRHETPVAGDPNGWLESIKAAGAQRALVEWTEPGNPPIAAHLLAAFVGGGGTWSLLVQYPEHVDRWLARWEVGDQNDPDRRVWNVTYGLVATTAVPPLSPLEMSRVDLNSLADRFRSVLAEAEALAVSVQYLEGFAATFRRALDMLTGNAPAAFPDYIEFVCLDCYPEIARRLFAAAYTGWVFGGMGSWNDLVPDDPDLRRQHEDVSARLYAVTTEAIEQAANSFAG
jgi:hypothetical protein